VPDFPRAATAAEVWAYGTRTLTGLTGQPRIDLMGEDADFEAGTGTRKSYLDAAISTRSSHAAADVWAVATRTLTGFTGTPRTDLLGEDASFEAGTGARKAALDRLPNIEAFDTPTEGTASFLTTDIYPKTVTIALSEVGVVHRVECYVDLSELAAGESLVVTEAMSIVSPVSYVNYAEETYSGVQTLPMLFVVTKPARYGLRIQLRMDAAPAADRSFPYQWFRKRVA